MLEGLAALIICLLIVALIVGTVYFFIEEPWDWRTKMDARKIERRAERNNTSAAFESTKHWFISSDIRRFANTDAEKIRRNQFSQQSISEFEQISNVFTEERVKELNCETNRKYGFDASSMSRYEWGQVFSTYRELLNKKVQQLREETEEKARNEKSDKSSVAGALFTIQEIDSPPSRLSITADVDDSASVENIVGTGNSDKGTDFRSHWEKQYEEIMSSNETSSQKA